MELCVGLGQEHPEGVLWFSDIEMVPAFSSASNMIAILCHLLWPQTGAVSKSSFVYPAPNDHAGKELHCHTE